MKAAYQGIPGAFGHQACLSFLPGHLPCPEESFAQVVEAVASRRVDRGVLPIANSAAGEVPGVRRLISGAGLVTCAELALPVRMHLLGLPHAELEDIRTVTSHPLALRQCARSLAQLNVRLSEAKNTALAAKRIAQVHIAALASERAAELYGLKILLRDMHDDPDNHTLFAVIARA